MNRLTSLSLLFFIAFFMNACSQVSRPSADRRAPAYTHQTPSVQQPSQQHSQVSQLPQQSSVPNIHPARARMVQVAKSALGVPYKWGGNNPQEGFDCSGLISYVHKNATGLKIPRTVAQQRDNSRTLNFAQLQPGDMLFFKINKKTNHAGIYIGDRKFIHAPSSGKRVKVASMDSSYWFKRFVKFGTYL